MQFLISMALFLTVLAAGAAEPTVGDLTGVWRGDQNGSSYELLIDGRNEASPVMIVHTKVGQLVDDTTVGVPTVVGQMIHLRYRSSLTGATITEDYTITRFEGDDMTLTSALMQFGGVTFSRFARELPEKISNPGTNLIQGAEGGAIPAAGPAVPLPAGGAGARGEP